MQHIRVPDCVDRKRRELIALLGGAIAWPLIAHAQQASKVWRIGYLGFGTAAGFADRAEALRAGLRDLGYIEGKNIVIEFRWAETVEQLQEAAAELVRMNVDVILRSLLPRPNAPGRLPTRSLSSSRRMPTPLGSDMSRACRGQAGTLRD